MSARQRRFFMRAGLRALLGLFLAVALAPWSHVPTAHAAAPPPPPRDARDWVRRIEVIVNKVTISDDHDWGEGDMHLRVELRRRSPSCRVESSPDCYVDLAATEVDFQASDGQTVPLNRRMPDIGLGATISEDSISPDIGIPMFPGQDYLFVLTVDEIDAISDDDLGEVIETLHPDNDRFLGTRVLRATRGDRTQPGDFAAEVEIRDAPLPDLRPAYVSVKGPSDFGRHLVCVDMRNDGRQNAGRYEFSVQVDGVTPAGGRSYAEGLAAGQAAEECVKLVLPPAGEHFLTAIIDEPRNVMEARETNNWYMASYTLPRVGQLQGPMTQAPVGADPTAPATEGTADLIVSAIKVNGQVPDGKNDCKDGKNAVAVTVKKAGTANAEAFVLALTVDGGDAIEKSVVGLEAGKERDVTFENVQLKKGERKLSATVDVGNAVAESKDDNNALKVAAVCNAAN